MPQSEPQQSVEQRLQSLEDQYMALEGAFRLVSSMLIRLHVQDSEARKEFAETIRKAASRPCEDPELEEMIANYSDLLRRFADDLS